MPPLSSIAAAGPVVIDLALIASLVAVFIGTIKPLVALKLDPTGTAYDSALQLLAVGSAAGLIYLAEYAPSVFAVVASSVAVAAGAIGGYRVVRGAAPVITALVAPSESPPPNENTITQGTVHAGGETPSTPPPTT